jgi:Mg-chelatase subunit ChlD
LTLLQPQWLLLVLPLAVLWWWLRATSRWLGFLRLSTYALIVFAMCDPQLIRPRRAGTVVVIADRSDSMPTDAGQRQAEMVKLLHKAMSPRDRLAVVSFGERAALEHGPGVEPFDGFEQVVGRGASDLSAALRRAVSLVPEDGAGRVLVLSDGRYTGRDPAVDAARAAGRGIAIDYRDISRTSAGDAAITRVDAPLSVQPGESFMITGWAHLPTPQLVTFELWRGATRIASGRRELPAGLSRLTFRDRAAGPGSAGYRFVIKGAAGDLVPENNTARFIVGVQGAKPLLLVSHSPGQGLGALLRLAGLELRVSEPNKVDASLQSLSNYAGVVLENVPASDLPHGTLERLAALVEDAGTGLFMTGGQSSFGPGGYFQSPIDPLLPVSMELRQEHRKLSLAIVVALDRSGSMAMTVPGGQMKMDLANLGTAQVVDLLSAMDEFGVIAVDSAPHVISPLARLDNKQEVKDKVLRIDSMGGGIYVFEALKAASAMLAQATPTTRHIILFSDAQDSEVPGAYRQLLRKCQKANITVSVIGLGTEHDVDAPLLKDIARLGNGRVFFTDDARKLPSLFAQDTFVVARSTFVDQPTPVRTTGVLSAMAGRSLSDPPALGGYNLTYLKPDASLGMVTRDEYTAPVVATWQGGLGRVAVYTGEADGEFTGAMAGWTDLGDLLTSLGRWVQSRDRQLPDTLLVRQDIDRGVLTVELLMDPQRPEAGLPGEPQVRLLVGRPGLAPQRLTGRLRYTATDTMTAVFPLAGDEVATATIDLGTLGKVTMPPVRLLYSPEYRPRTGNGRETLRTLANMTGGVARAELASLWGDLPTVDRRVSVAHWLWLLAVVLILLEVLERRTGWVSASVPQTVRIPRFTRRRAAQQATTDTSTPRGRKRHVTAAPGSAPNTAEPTTPAIPDAPGTADITETPDTPTIPDTPGEGLASALDKARRRADRRTGRDG